MLREADLEGALVVRPGSRTWGKFFFVPWALWNVMIGWAVYVHHIHPRIVWLPRHRWSKLRGQVHGTTTYETPRWTNVIWHNIFEHAAHHVDPQIPFYNLPRASAALAAAYPDLVRRRPYRLRDYVAITRRCKLFDFDAGVWRDYDGNVASEV